MIHIDAQAEAENIDVVISVFKLSDGIRSRYSGEPANRLRSFTPTATVHDIETGSIPLDNHPTKRLIVMTR